MKFLRPHRWTVLLVSCLLYACGGGDGSGTADSASGSGSSSGAANVVALTVNSGPAAAKGGTFNIPYTSVTVCLPKTTTCATIANVLVDTGSAGLRLMASAVAAAGLTLTDMPDPNNAANTVAECLPFADGYTWGPLAVADIRIGGESAPGVSVNIIDDDSSYAPAAPSSCTGGLTSLNAVADFAANGVLGIGLFDEDCGLACVNCGLSCSKNNDFYYTCTSSANGCTFTPLALTSQVRNPVALFATDNNGVIVQLPAVAPNGSLSATGSLIFGIGTQSNNGLGSATVFMTDRSGNITTTYKGQALSSSFIDSGSNGLYFADSTITTCSDASNPHASDFYCPTSTLSLTATNQGLNGTTNVVSFQIADLDNISASAFAINDVGGGIGGFTGRSAFFDWGLPFFYGRSVYTAIEGKTAGSATGPYYAY